MIIVITQTHFKLNFFFKTLKISLTIEKKTRNKIISTIGEKKVIKDLSKIFEFVAF